MKKNYENWLENFISHSNAIENEAKTMDKGSENCWNYLIEQKELTPEVICKAHGYLMQYKNIEPKFRGKFREVPVWIGGEKKENAMAIPNEMKDWCIKANQSHYSLLGRLRRHITFEKIHPFIDGNGRLGRLLFLWDIYKNSDFRITFYFDEEMRKYYYQIFDLELKDDFYWEKLEELKMKFLK